MSPALGIPTIILILLVAISPPSATTSSTNTNTPTTFTGKDITPQLFPGGTTGNAELFPAAYADFNGDKITDIFMVDRNRSSFHLYFGHEEPPYYRPTSQSTCKLTIDWSLSPDHQSSASQQPLEPVEIVGITPADFNGDGLLDVMVAFHQRNASGQGFIQNITQVVIFPGNLTLLHCDVRMKESDILYFVHEPMVLDLNGDMIMDLFGEGYVDIKNESNITAVMYYLFKPAGVGTIEHDNFVEFIPKNPNGFDDKLTTEIANPAVNSFLDVDGDFIPELIIGTSSRDSGREVYQMNIYKVQSSSTSLSFTLQSPPVTIDPDPKSTVNVIGQSIFMDLNQDGHLDHLIPFCAELDCGDGGGIKVVNVSSGGTFQLPIAFTDETSATPWTFMPPFDRTKPGVNPNKIFDFYMDTIVLRVGDYNLDGFPDLIGILQDPSKKGPAVTGGGRAVLFENIPCVSTLACNGIDRTFKVNFKALASYENVILASFFDFHEDGLLDVMFVRRTNDETGHGHDKYSLYGFENSPDYDANFLKVMVLSGLPCPYCLSNDNQIPYGNIISGPIITYNTTTQIGNHQTAVAVQYYRSSYIPLDVPYTIIGIGSSPNFIETLEIRIPIHTGEKTTRFAEWTQIIPNSQIIVVPMGPDSSSWTAKLFLTPSKAVLHTFGVLVGFCVGILGIIAFLQWRENKADKLERMKAHRFHMM